MKIAIFTDAFYPMTNGVVTSTIAFVKELSKRGIFIMIFCPYQKGIEDFYIENTEIIALKGIPAFFYPEFKFTTFSTPKVLSKIRSFKPDLIHFHTQFVIGLKGIIIGKIFNIPIVGTYHTKIADENYLKNIGMDKNEFFKKYARKYNNFYYNNANIIISPSKESKKELIDKGIKSSKIKVIFNPILLENNEKPSLNYLDGINGKLILYIGRLSKEKNIETAIKIFIEVQKKEKNTKFILVGDGPIKERLEQIAIENNLKDNIIFLGLIKHQDLINSNIFNKCSLFFTASLSETFGITIIEAMHFGLPIIGFKKGGIKELVKNGFNGYLSKEGDYEDIKNNILKILNNKEIQKSLSINSKEHSKNFDSKLLTDKLLKIYNSLIKKN